MATAATQATERRLSGWQRAFLRLPLVYWRLGLKPLLARARSFDFVVLTTRGRKTGRARHTMLTHYVLDGRMYIGAGWGERTHWYRNILADPRVTAESRGPAFGAIARPVTDSELQQLYWLARAKGPRWMWERSLASWGIQDDVEDFVAKKGRIPFLRLDPIGDCPWPPLRADLWWVWPAAAGAALSMYVLLR